MIQECPSWSRLGVHDSPLLGIAGNVVSYMNEVSSALSHKLVDLKSLEPPATSSTKEAYAGKRVLFALTNS